MESLKDYKKEVEILFSQSNYQDYPGSPDILEITLILDNVRMNNDIDFHYRYYQVVLDVRSFQSKWIRGCVEDPITCDPYTSSFYLFWNIESDQVRLTSAPEYNPNTFFHPGEKFMKESLKIPLHTFILSVVKREGESDKIQIIYEQPCRCLPRPPEVSSEVKQLTFFQESLGYPGPPQYYVWEFDPWNPTNKKIGRFETFPFLHPGRNFDPFMILWDPRSNETSLRNVPDWMIDGKRTRSPKRALCMVRGVDLDSRYEFFEEF